MQANTGRGSEAHDLALSLAFQNRIDIILIQEPWIHRNRQRRLTKKHLAYEYFSPIDNWETRSRTLTYIRSKANLRPTQFTTGSKPNPDILTLQLHTHKSSNLFITNIYNASAGAEGEERALNSLTASTWSKDQHILIAGDFNLKHDLWQPSTQQMSPRAEALIQWTTTNHLSLISPIGEPTHNKGNTLDLTWASEALLKSDISTQITEDLHTTSDHHTLLTHIHHGPGPRLPKSETTHYRLDTTDKSLFYDTLEATITHSQAIATEATHCNDETRIRDLLDLLADSIITAIDTALSASTKKTSGCGMGHSWWDDACQQAVRKY